MMIVVIGASAGGSEAIDKICSTLPNNFNGSLFIVWHLAEDSLGLLPNVIGKKSKMPASNAIDGEKIKPGHIYTAPPNKHLLIEDNKIRVVYGPKENRFRPAIDPLFRSAAFYHRENVVGIILSGMLNDGVAGLWTVKDKSGITIVQDPADALYNDMPRYALRNVGIDYKIPAEEIAPLLIKLSKKAGKYKKPIARPKRENQLEMEINMAMDKSIPEEEIKKLGKVSEFTCPECHGSLWKMDHDNILRFRCRTGHAYTMESLLKGLSENVEIQVWKAIRGLEENASVLRHFVTHPKEDEKKSAKEYLTSAEESEKQANILRRFLMDEIGIKSDVNSEKEHE